MPRPALNCVVLACFATLLCACGPVIVSDKARMLNVPRERVELSPAGRSISLLRVGDATLPRLIYVHGTPGDATEWANYLTDPVPGFESIAIDRLGFGESTTALDPATGREVNRAVTGFAEQVAALEPLLVERDGRWPILLGHSLGGPIVALAAARHPEKVAGLVILAGSLDPTLEEPQWYNIAATWGVVSWMLSADLRVSNAEIMAAKGETLALQGELALITCPVVVVQGSKDELVPRANVEYIRRSLVNAQSVEVIELPEAGHFLPWENEQVVRDAIERVRRQAGSR